MYRNYRKSNRLSNKNLLKLGQVPKKFIKFFYKNSFFSYNKLSPHKIKSKKKKAFLMTNMCQSSKLLASSLFVKNLCIDNNVVNNNLFRLNVTDLGYIFLTPGVPSPKIIVNLNFSNFILSKKILGLPQFKFSVGDVISNIESNVTNGFWCKSRGSKAVIVQSNSRGIEFLLPSGFKKLKGSVSSYSGPNLSLKPYTSKRSMRVKLMVRGIAKNPVDHPNGGRSNTKGSFKTP